MKTYGKKILTALLTLTLIISVAPNMAYAADTTSSTDNNDTFGTATSLSSAGEVTGVLSSKDDVDFYKYTVDVSGYYNFVFKNLSSEDGSWYITVYDASLNELESERNEGYTLTTGVYDFKKGTDLYIKVEYDNLYEHSVDKQYSLKVNATSDDTWEKEYNDTKATATIINQDKGLNGNLYSSDDVDFYKYTVDVSGYYNFIFKNLSSEDGSWYITVYDSSFNKLESERNEGYTDNSSTYNFKKGTVLYYKVEYDNLYGHSVGKQYSLTVNAKKNSNWEQEKDNSYGKAIALKANTTKYGNLYIADDVDYYSYTAAKTGSLKTTFKFDADDVKDGWEITVYDSSKKEVKRVSDITTNKTISFKATKGKNYYVVVRADSNSAPTGITYALKIK
jgi:hypothetical protein